MTGGAAMPTGGGAPPKVASPTAGRTAASITSVNDLGFEEWAECRKTIGRLDGLIQDLRKYGFSLIIGLLSVSAFLGSLGIPVQGVAAAGLPVEVRAALPTAIIVLIAALFSVDTYYGILLSGAVERALDLEIETEPPVRITKYLSTNALNTSADRVNVGLYLVLVFITAVLGLLALSAAPQAAATELIAAPTASEVAHSTNTEVVATTARLAVASAQAASIPVTVERMQAAFVVFSGATFAWIVWYRGYCNRKTCQNRSKIRSWPEGDGKLPERPCQAASAPSTGKTDAPG